MIINPVLMKYKIQFIAIMRTINNNNNSHMISNIKFVMRKKKIIFKTIIQLNHKHL